MLLPLSHDDNNGTGLVAWPTLTVSAVLFLALLLPTQNDLLFIAIPRILAHPLPNSSYAAGKLGVVHLRYVMSMSLQYEYRSLCVCIHMRYSGS